MIDVLKDLMDLADLADAADAASSLSDLADLADVADLSDLADVADATDLMDAADVFDPFLNSESLTMANDIDGLDYNFESMTSIDHSNVSFEGKQPNIYDKHTADFLKECKKENYDLPKSVTHHDTHIDRSFDGGLTSIDKSIIRDQINRDFKDGKITEEVRKNLLRKVSNC